MIYKLRKVLSFILVLILSFTMILDLAFASASSNNISWYLTEDFSIYATNGTADALNVTSGTPIVVADKDETNKYLSISTSAGLIAFNQNFECTVEKLKFSIELGFSGNLDNATISLGNFKVATIKNDKSVLAFDGNPIGTLSSDMTTAFTFEFNKTHKRYSIYINEKKAISDYYVDVAYPDVISGYSINAIASGELTVYVDNIYAYSADNLVKKKNLPKSEYNKDILEIVEYDDVMVTGRKVGSYFDFEEDDYWFKDDADFDTWYLSTNPNGNSIEVKAEENGNHYLSLDSVSTTKNSFFCAISIYTGQYIIEADVRTPTKSSVLFTAHDDAKNSGVFFSATKDSGAITMNNQTLGYLNPDEWTRVGIAVDTNKRTLNYYINGEHKGGDVPLPSNLGGIVSLRMQCARSHDNNTLMLDNIIVYSGTEPYDFSEMFKGKVDENVFAYDHNTEGVKEYLKNFNVINTDTGKMYIDELEQVTKMPYYDGDKLMVSLADAEKLVLGSSTSAESDKFVSLDEFAGENGKVVTYTRTDTVIVGDRKTTLTDSMIKYVNALVTYDRPDRETLKSSFTGARPRATINGMKLQQIKDNYGKDKYITMWVDQMIATANSLLDAPLQQFTPPGGTDARLMMAARNAGWAVQRLAIAYHLTGGTNQAYVDRAWAEIENACNYPHWHHQWNDLDPAYMVCAMSYGYDWFYDQWSPEQRKIIEDAVWKFQLDLAYQSYHGYKYNAWATVLTNWNVIINGYNTMAASVFFESNPDKAADIIENSIRCMEVALGEFYPNGAWGEGVGYLNGTVKPLGEAIYTLKNTFGSYFNLHNAPCLDMTCDYFVSTTGPKGTNNFNDAGVIVSPTIGSFFWMSDVFGDPEFTALRLIDIDKGIATDENVYELMFYNPDIKLENTEIPLDSYFDNIELVSLKGKNSDENTAWVSFHSGEGLAGLNHSHIDSGTFVLDMLGERFVGDLANHYYYSTGWGNVTRIQPKGTTLTRWDYYQNIPEGHNCILINPKDEDIGQNIISSDKVETYVSKERGAFAVTSLASAYKGYADDVRRGIMLTDDRRSVIVRDEIDLFDGQNDVYWFLHTDIGTKLELIDNKTVIMTLNDKKVKLSFISNADSFEIYETEAPHTEAFILSPEQRPINNFKKLNVKMKARDNLYIQAKFIPLDDPVSGVPQENISLDEWNIPDGELREIPTIDAIYIDGKKYEEFNPDVISHVIPVKLGETKSPEITFDVNDNYHVTFDSKPESVDEKTIIRVARKDLPELYKIYTIRFNPYSIKDIEPYKILPVAAEASVVPQPENGPDDTYDNDLNTRYAGEGKGVWLISDLGDVKDIDFIGISFMNGNARIAKYQLFISEDGENWEQVFDGTSSGTTTDIEITDRIKKKARYIKFVGFGNTVNDWNSINELCAYSLGF